jgi:hypothetical protein
MEWVVAQGQSLESITCSEWRCVLPAKGTNMRSIIGRLIYWAAEILDRNLITVPELDEEYSARGTNC